MKTAIFLFFVLVMYASIAKAGLPPTTAAGQNQSNTTTFNFKVPNNLATNIGGGTLLESGNTNILVNPSFEHVTFNTGWTTSGGSAVEETSVLVHGRKAMVFVASNTVSIRQDSFLYTGANQFPLGGVQGLASIRINTTVAGLRVCPRQAGAINASLCVSVVNDGRWGLYKVPFILGGTSNGIEISSTSSVSGNIYVDDAFVGVVDLKADVPAVIVNSASASGAINAGAQFSGSFTVVGSPSVFTQNSGVITFTKRVSVSASFSLTSSTTTTVIPSIEKNNVSQTGDNTPAVLGNRSSSSYASIFEVGDTLSFENTGPGNASASTISFVATSVDNGSVYTSTNADTDWASCGHVPADFTGFGTVTNIETQCKREGSDLLMRGKFTSGATTAVEARVNLKLSGLTLTSAPSSIIPSIQPAGDAVRNANSTTYFRNTVLIEPATSYITFGSQTSLANGLTKMTGSGSGIGSGEILAINARIPISGWNNSNIIIGQFNGLESCTDSYECTDTFSALVSGGTVSGENVDWLNGNCSLSGTGNRRATCTVNTSLALTNGMNCVATTNTSVSGAFDAGSANVASTSSTTIIVDMAQSSDGVGVSKPFYLICQKQGADYIGKTAKAVASDQNDRTPGITNAVEVSANVTCSGSSSVQSFIGVPSMSVSNISAGVCNLTVPSTTFSNYNNVICNGVYKGSLGTGNIRSLGIEMTSQTNILVDCVQPSADCTSYAFALSCKGQAP